MPQATRSILVDVAPAQLLSVISDVERYPEFLPEVKSVAVHSRTPTLMEATYEVDLLKRIRYTLRLTTDELSVRWTLVKGDLFKKNEGAWVLRPEGEGRTHLTYSLELALGGLIPVPAAVTDKLAEGSLPGMLSRMKQRAEALFPRR